MPLTFELGINNDFDLFILHGILYNMLIIITLLLLIHDFTSDQTVVLPFRYCKTCVLYVPWLIYGMQAAAGLLTRLAP